MNNYSKTIAIAISALMLFGAFVMVFQSDNVSASDSNREIYHIDDCIKFDNKEINDDLHGLYWDGRGNGKIDNLNLVYDCLPEMNGRAFYLFDFDSTFEVVGHNTITLNIADDKISYVEAIYSKSLALVGGGSLTIVLNSVKANIKELCGIDAQGDLGIYGCKVNVICNNGTDITDVYGIKSTGGISIVDGAFGFAMNNVVIYGGGCGINSTTALEIVDSDVIVKCVTKGTGSAYGIRAQNLGVSGSDVRVEASTSAYLVQGSIDIDRTIFGGNVIGGKPTDVIDQSHIGEYKVVWIKTDDRPSVAFLASVIIVSIISLVIFGYSFARKH